MTQRRSVALGSFDGLHRGHRAVLDLALSFEKDGFEPCALVFDEHPLKVVGAGAPPELMTPQARDEMLESLGITVKKISFGRIADMSAEQFVNDILTQVLSAADIITASQRAPPRIPATSKSSARRAEFCAPWRSAPTITARR